MTYRGRVQLGDENGPIITIEIDNIDAASWQGQPMSADVIPGSTTDGALTVKLLDGNRAGELADAALQLHGDEDASILVGHTAFEPEDANQAAARTLRQATERK